MLCYIVISNFFVSFEIIAVSWNILQNTLRLINKFENFIQSFMEGLIADFIQVSRAIAKFLFLQGRLDYVCTQSCDFTNFTISSFSKLFGNS